ncbi:CHAT domain-containing protein [Magnetospirillum aberrantis]|uniref:CHAT domain-containing protein n=1 Tax=Magnetospirillum aberrantis SpK TaxID=908842 RepID=A0A7C9UTZ4_9PROT|nr:CHAT domain-containing protein [Magnetospirillum aberrantis]NFV80368.1 CHAT domain-containing protein [Magnetospirillum aberrantis SpK]
MPSDGAATQFARQVAAEAEPAARRALLQAHPELIDAAFMDALRDVAPDRAEDLVIEAMEVGRPQDVAAVHLVAALLQAWQEGRLDEAEKEHAADITADFVDTVLQTAEDAAHRHAATDTALILLKLARRLIRRFGFDDMMPHLHLCWSSLALLTDDDQTAETMVKAALADPRLDNQPLVRQALDINHGLVLLRQGRYDEAIAAHTALIGTLDDQVLRAAARSNLALAHAEKGEIGTALALLDDLERDCRRDGDHDHLVSVLGNKANLVGRLGLHDEEHHLREQTLDLASHPVGGKARDWQAVITSQANLALFHLRHGKPEQARRWIEMFRQSCERQGDHGQRVMQIRLEVELALVEGDAERAWSLGRDALDRLPDSVDPEYLALTGSVSRAARMSGRIDQSVDLFLRQLRLAEETGHRELAHAGLGHLGLSLHATGDRDGAHALFARMFAADSGLRHLVSGELTQFTLSSTREQMYAEVVKAVAEEDDAERLFHVVQGAKAFALGHAAPAMEGWQEFRATLEQGSILLEYYVHGPLAFCLVAATEFDQPVRVDLPVDQTRLEAAANVFRASLPWARWILRHDPFDGLDALGKALAEPLRPWLENRHTMVVCPSGAMSGIPFHLLPTGDGRRIIDHIAVTQAPSATVHAASRSRRAEGRKAVCLSVAAATDSPQSQTLFDQEARQVAALLSARGFEAISSPDIADWQGSAIVHLAAHGHFDPSDPRAGSLSMGAPVTLEVLARAQLDADLVFLSGCDTGRVHPLRGQEALGFMPILLGRGARSAILSFWPILARSSLTPAIATDFYRHWLVEGMPKASALRRAMLRWRDRPLYEWGGYGVFGCGQ